MTSFSSGGPPDRSVRSRWPRVGGLTVGRAQRRRGNLTLPLRRNLDQTVGLIPTEVIDLVPRRIQVAGIVAIAVAVLTGIVTNYVSADAPSWLSDPIRNWLILGLLVSTAIVITLLTDRTPIPPEPIAPSAPTFGDGAESLSVPSGESQLHGRTAVLRDLRRTATRPNGRFVVVTGAGGMGKTALAESLSGSLKNAGKRVFWVRWRSLEHLAGQMQEVASRLGLPEEVIGAAQRAGSSRSDLVWQHLSRTQGWVVVIDDLDQPASACVSGEPISAYRGWIRPTGGGLLLVTSRHRDAATWGTLATIVPIGPLDVDDAATLLLEASPRDSCDEAAARELAARLGGLPLALHAAASAISEPIGRYPTLAAYATALAERTAHVLPARPDVLDATIARRLVGYTWELSLDQLASEGLPAARALLRLVALYANAPIPRALISVDLFTPQVIDAVGLTVGPDNLIAASMLDAALAGLHRYGLVDAPDPLGTGGVSTIALHPVVQEAAIGLLAAAIGDSTEWQLAVDNALLCQIRKTLEAGRDGWTLARLLAPHAFGLIHRYSSHRSNFNIAREAIDRLCDELSRAGFVRIEASLREAILEAESSVFGHDSSDALISGLAYAAALQQLGEYRRSAALYLRNVALRERVYGTDHRYTLNARSGLAHSLFCSGDYEGAADRHLENIVAREQLLGSDDPDTIDSRDGYASAQYALGNYELAASLHRQNLRDRERLLGLRDPDTLSSRNNLAYALCELALHGEAAELHRKNIAIREEDLGSRHPDTLNSLFGLAFVLNRKGDHEAAAGMLESSLTDREMLPGGLEHPDTFESRHELAVALVKIGQCSRAVSLHRQNLTDRVRVLGSDHPETQRTRRSLVEAENEARRTRRWHWRG